MPLNEQDKKDIAEMVKSTVAALLPKPEPKPEPAAKALPDGLDITNPAAVAAFKRQRRIDAAAEATDWNDDASIAQYEATLADITKSDKPGDEELPAVVAKSNAPTGESTKEEPFDHAKAGKAHAAFINKSNGYKV